MQTYTPTQPTEQEIFLVETSMEYMMRHRFTKHEQSVALNIYRDSASRGGSIVKGTPVEYWDQIKWTEEHGWSSLQDDRVPQIGYFNYSPVRHCDKKNTLKLYLVNGRAKGDDFRKVVSPLEYRTHQYHRDTNSLADMHKYGLTDYRKMPVETIIRSRDDRSDWQVFRSKKDAMNAFKNEVARYIHRHNQSCILTESR